MKMKWKRVVADEGHVMKNPKAKSSDVLTLADTSDPSLCCTASGEALGMLRNTYCQFSKRPRIFAYMLAHLCTSGQHRLLPVTHPASSQGWLS